MKHCIRNTVKSTFVVLLIGILAVAANAQSERNANLYETLEAQNVPTRMAARDLTSDWHVVTSGSTNLFLSFMGSGDSPILMYYYTEGKTFTFGAQEYLIAYHAKDASSYSNQRYSPPQYYGYGNQAENKESLSLLEDAQLSLSLLSLSDAQSFHEIKLFDPEVDLVDSDIAVAQESESNLKQVALGLTMYTQDYDEKIPPMIAARSADDINGEDWNKPDANVQNRLSPYVKNDKVFLHPRTKRPYLPNYKISRKYLHDIKTSPKTTFTFYEDAPDSDDKRTVAYLDGHVARISECEFQRQRKAQGISESGLPSAMPSKKP